MCWASVRVSMQQRKGCCRKALVIHDMQHVMPKPELAGRKHFRTYCSIHGTCVWGAVIGCAGCVASVFWVCTCVTIGMAGCLHGVCVGAC